MSLTFTNIRYTMCFTIALVLNQTYLHLFLLCICVRSSLLKKTTTNLWKYVATSYLPTYVYRSTIARTYTRMQTVLQLLMPTYTRRILRCELVFVSDLLKLLEDFCVYLHTGRRLQKCRHTRTPLPQSPLLSLLDSQIDNHLQDVCFRRQSP